MHTLFTTLFTGRTNRQLTSIKCLIVLFAVFIFACKDNEKEAAAFLEIAAEQQTIHFETPDVDTVLVTVKTNRTFTASVATTGQSWCSTQIIKDKETDNLIVNVVKNTTTEERTTTITVTAEGLPTGIELSVKQASGDAPPFIEIAEEQRTLQIEPDASVIFVTVNTNQSFVATVATAGQEWCTAEITEGNEAGNLKISVSKNEMARERTTTITVTADELPAIEITVNQHIVVYEGFPRFAVISDIHFENNRGEGAQVKVPKALKNLMSKTPLVDALFVVGDLTDNGREDQYDILKAAFANPSNISATVPVYYLMGNHDNLSGANAATYYRNKLGQPLHQYIIIKGYPFITISQTGTASTDYNNEAQTFLRDHLAKAATDFPGRPIFVFTHVPPQNTCYGSSVSDGWGSSVFPPILRNYPQVIVFSGHSHFPLGDPRSIHQGDYTAVNDGSTTYSEVEPYVVTEGIHPAKYEYITEGVIVNVKEEGNTVEMERWDTYRNEEILPRWQVKAPFDGSRFALEYKNRNGQPVPSFATGVKPTASGSEDEWTITFPQATDNEVVHHYIVDVVNNQDVAVRSIRRFSQYYLNSAMPPFLTTAFSDLPEGEPLVAKVTAVDSYNNRSEPVVSEPFIPVVVSVDPPPAAGHWLFDDADLTKALVGEPLVPSGSGFTSIDGPAAGNKAVRVPQGSYYKLLHGFAANGGGSSVNEYTLMIHLRVPSIDRWYALFQTDLNNGNDGDCFINPSGKVGLGDSGYSSASLTANVWHRIVVTAKLGAWYRIYLDGTLAVDSNTPAVDSRYSWSLQGVLLFADDNGEDNALDVAEIAVWNQALSSAKVKALGK
ncbi:MAG: 5'-cyclic adenosine monophosphate phosphodiesterase CpdA [Candidatus Ordinivivax streblomastigis]|uniref:5'-cyclic adenosine monophosphate phosphodiesterase CpdA n=1 Tax=Candidatus Ordinivivax streblomastigis TaxID=2540710 RepID=A0A5M8NV99_9BACT|nr:MAG: 5'-cyclic adenosine monophosphate phosphodiesterase CpdA [Candidatus Ordinivivax streblomastigis]